MKQRIITLVMLAGLVTMLAGCSETFSPKKGDGIRFTAINRGNPNTKTNYAGYTAGNNFERIRWNVGDSIRIFSMNTKVVKANWLNANQNNHFDYYDYKISSRKDSADRYDKGKLTWSEEGAGEGYGMVWVDNPYEVPFYGVYPSAEPQYNKISETEYGTTIIAFQGMNILQEQSVAEVEQGTIKEGVSLTNMKPDMSHAYMISDKSTFNPRGTDAYGQSIPYMEMEFYPVFNAFYIELLSQDSDMKINSVTLTTTSTSVPLFGNFKYLFEFANDKPSNGVPSMSYVSIPAQNSNQSVTVDLTGQTDANRTVTPTHGVGVTLLTLPGNITALTLTVNYDDNKSKSLALNNNVTATNPTGTPITFNPFYKTRLTGLAMEGGSKWQLIIDDQVLPWIADEETTSFRTQIGIKDKSMTGMVEIDASNPDPNCGRNEYEAANGYEKYYQIRTVLLGQLGGEDPHIEFEFTPTAPIGGYWSLSVESASPNAVDYFAITVNDGINGESERLQGQVMSIPVKIFIRPSELFRTSTEAAVHSILIHCNVSPSKDFDPTYSADSEFQDVHSDGRYSYWKFRLIKD